MAIELSTPVITVSVLVVAYYALRFIFSPREPPITRLEPLPFQRFTPKTLAQYDGLNGPRILLAVGGKVFDVSVGRSFYGPDGPYGNFAGRDASRGMAKQSFELDMLTPIDQPIDKLEDLTKEERENLKTWIEHFSFKYHICGELVESSTD